MTAPDKTADLHFSDRESAEKGQTSAPHKNHRARQMDRPPPGAKGYKDTLVIFMQLTAQNAAAENHTPGKPDENV